MRKYESAPHPFVLSWESLKKSYFDQGEEFAFNLTLIGKAIDYLPYFIFVFDELGKRGLGTSRGRYELLAVYSIASDSSEHLIYSGKDKNLKASHKVIAIADLLTNRTRTERLALKFLTPTRIKYSEKLVIDLEFHILIRNLLRRIANLSYFHCDEEPDLDFKQLIAKAMRVKCTGRQLRWQDLERYSARQETKMKLGGFVGEVSFQGHMDEFMPFLLLGEHLHVGKGTSFGLGRYKII